MKDGLVIGYDIGKECGDISCLQALRKNGRGYEIVTTFYEEDADRIYKKIVEHN